MRSNYFIALSAILFFTIACADKKNNTAEYSGVTKETKIMIAAPAVDSIEAGKVITNIICQANPDQSYALYIPAKGNNKTLPIVYFFDPHGDGALPVTKYKALADAYNFILAGSNNSKNGNDLVTGENIWNTLFNDSQKRLKINASRIYLCGFSGGAKVATYLCLHHREIKGLIANGAGMPGITDGVNFTFTAIAGEGDMNMTDLVAINNGLGETQVRHRIIFFNGIHEWAPESTMDIAFAGLQMDAMLQKTASHDNAFITNYIDSSKKRIADYSRANNYIKAERECTLSLNILNGLTNETAWFTEKDKLLKNNPAYQKQLQAEQNLLLKETNIKNVFQQQFQLGDNDYWTKTISEIQAEAKIATPEGAMYKRLLAYLSLAFYSISNRFIEANNNNEAAYFTALYKTTDAANNEAWYLSAIINARNNNATATKNDLLKAVTLGFSDKQRLLNQKEFIAVLSPTDFAEIEHKLK